MCSGSTGGSSTPKTPRCAGVLLSHIHVAGDSVVLLAESVPIDNLANSHVSSVVRLFCLAVGRLAQLAGITERAFARTARASCENVCGPEAMTSTLRRPMLSSIPHSHLDHRSGHRTEQLLTGVGEASGHIAANLWGS